MEHWFLLWMCLSNEKVIKRLIYKSSTIKLQYIILIVDTSVKHVALNFTRILFIITAHCTHCHKMNSAMINKKTFCCVDVYPPTSHETTISSVCRSLTFDSHSHLCENACDDWNMANIISSQPTKSQPISS